MLAGLLAQVIAARNCARLAQRKIAFGVTCAVSAAGIESMDQLETELREGVDSTEYVKGPALAAASNHATVPEWRRTTR